MKNFFLGLLIGLLLIAPAAKALEINIDQVTIRDLFAASALAGSIAKYGDDWKPSEHAQWAWSCSNELMYIRNRK